MSCICEWNTTSTTTEASQVKAATHYGGVGAGGPRTLPGWLAGWPLGSVQ